MAMEALLARRFAPLNFLVVPSFPNPTPSFSGCPDFLPIFSGNDEDNPAQHLIKFHQCIDQLDVYHEDDIMKMFVYSLEGDARQWYQSLPISSISSLKDFHVAFHSYCKRIYPVERLFEHCCEGYVLYTQNFVDCSSSSADEGDDNIEEEEEDSLSAISSSNYVLQWEKFQQSDIEIDNNDTLDAFGINPNVSNSSDYET
jgi:hypothetical protein